MNIAQKKFCLHFWGLSLYTAILGQFIRSIDIYDFGVQVYYNSNDDDVDRKNATQIFFLFFGLECKNVLRRDESNRPSGWMCCRTSAAATTTAAGNSSDRDKFI